MFTRLNEIDVAITRITLISVNVYLLQLILFPEEDEFSEYLYYITRKHRWFILTKI